MKRCGYCKKWKRESEFGKNKTMKNGLQNTCKMCVSIVAKKYKINHSDKVKEQNKKYRETHLEQNIKYRDDNQVKIKERDKKYYKTHLKKIKNQQGKYYKKHSKDLLEYANKYREIHRDELREKSNKYRILNIVEVNKRKREYEKNNRGKINKYSRALKKTRKKNDPQYKLSYNMSTAIWNSLKGNKNGHHWENILGYSLQELKIHLESQFAEKMSWENYGEWHVDHIIPQSVFNFTSYNDIDFKRCWALSNLQPLWAIDNIRKSNKLKETFQPSLALELVS